jgi:glycosyltransferase 2 family protein
MKRLPARRAALRRAAPWVGVAVTGVFGYLAVRHVQWSDAWSAFRSSTPWWLLPALAALAVAVGLRAIRWQALFAPERRPPLAATTRALLVGYFFNNVLPARAGEAARVVALHRSSGTPRAELAATVVVERIFDVLSLVVLFFLVSPWLPHVSWAASAAVVGVAVAGACLLLVAAVALWNEKPFRLLLRPLTLLPFLAEERLGRAALNLTHGLAAVRRPRVALAAFAWTMLSWLALAFSAWLVLLGFDSDLSPLAGVLVVVAINLALILPSGPAAVGVFEAATVVALSAFDVRTSTALSAALVLHLLNLVPYLAAGGVVLHPLAHGESAVARVDGPGADVVAEREP